MNTRGRWNQISTLMRQVFGVYALRPGHWAAIDAVLADSSSVCFWFGSFQNRQSEFLASASMVWLAVCLGQRWSPESKPEHASHAETGR